MTSHKMCRAAFAFAAVLAGASTAAHATAILTFTDDAAASTAATTVKLDGLLANNAGKPIVTVPSFSFSLPLGSSQTVNILSITEPSAILEGGRYTVDAMLVLTSPVDTISKVGHDTYVEIFGSLTADAFTWTAPLTSSYEDAAGDDFKITYINTVGFTASPSTPLNVAATFTYVPEPASLALLGAGLFGLGMIRRRRQC